MKKPRLWAIPDIHGRLDLLLQLLESLRAKGLDLTQDKLIFMGDYVDRGPDSAGVLAQIRELERVFAPNVIVLAGNHEWLMIDACTKGADHFDLWLVNGGGATLRSYPCHPYMESKVPDDVIKWLAALPLFHEEPGFFFSHAPVPKEHYRKSHRKGLPYEKDELIWTYDFDEAKIANDFRDRRGVCGHIHNLPRSQAKPRFYKHYIMADAGCGCWPKAPLVAIDVETEEVVYSYPAEAMESQYVQEQSPQGQDGKAPR